MRLVISLATRNRPKQLIEVVKRDLQCLSVPNTLLMVHVDEDDAETMAVVPTLQEMPRVEVTVRPREDTVAAKWNRALAVPADLYMLAGDDDPIVTPDADARILKAYEHFDDGIGFVFGRLCNASFASIHCMSRRVVDRVGYFQPEYFPYWFCDHWTDDLARLIGRIETCDVRTDQSNVGRTMEMREPGWWATWFDATYAWREREAQSIIEMPEFKASAEEKKRLIRNFQLVRDRSVFINSGVRSLHEYLHRERLLGDTTDPRYQRVKQRAVQMLDDTISEEYRKLLLPMRIPSPQRAYA